VEETHSFFAVAGGGDVTTEKEKQDFRGYVDCGKPGHALRVPGD
jgi:hypothetical protein